MKCAIGQARLLLRLSFLAEFANFLAESKARSQVAPFLEELRRDSRFEIVIVDGVLFWDGVEFYNDRADKEWGLIDCISFMLMDRRSIRDALSADHHFAQVGFRILLK